jgi:hypothetical protein
MSCLSPKLSSGIGQENLEVFISPFASLREIDLVKEHVAPMEPIH